MKVASRATANALIDRHTRIARWAIYFLAVPELCLGFIIYRLGFENLVASLMVMGVMAVLLVLFGLLRSSFYLLRRNLRTFADDRIAAANRAQLDHLTGALSRSALLDALQVELTAPAPEPVAYLQVDMDHLKVLNDGDGHPAGDAALLHLVRTIRQVAPNAVVGRLGGDEFGILLIGCSDRLVAQQTGADLLEAFNRPVPIAGREVRLSATVGVAVAPLDSTYPDELISLADLALYEAKRTGRGKVIMFDQEMLIDARHKRFIKRELRAAILLDELDLHYQPIYGEDGVTLTGYEALVRWQHKVRGIVPPSEFIHIAEESDLISRLGEWVLRRACLDLPALRSPSVSINVSAAQLRRSDFAERFVSILGETGMPGHKLTVEITETVPLQANAVEERNLTTLRALGVRVAIDDFGAGHASLEYLKKFSFDIIKIDRSYIMNLADNPVDRVLVAAICEIGRHAEIEIVAEGVETEEQLALLKSLGCRRFQGYLLGRPQPLRRQLAMTQAA